MVEDIHNMYSGQYSEYIKNSHIAIRTQQKKKKGQKTQALTMEGINMWGNYLDLINN